MQKSILAIVCVVFLTSTLCGCGLFLAIPVECKNELPSTNARDVLLLRDPGYRPQRSTKEEFLKEWGKPVKIIAPSENKETWVYERSLWCGFGPIIFFIPIPLLLPVCDGFEHIEFHGDKAKNLHIRRIVFGGGVIPGPAGADPVCRFPLHATTEIIDRLRPSELYESYGIRSVDLKALSKCPLPPTINIVNVETSEADHFFISHPVETVNPKELMDGIVEYLKYGYERSQIKVDNNSAKIIQLSFINARLRQARWFSWKGMIQISVDIPETKYSQAIYKSEDERRKGDIYTPIAHAIHGVTRKIIDDPVIQDYILCK